jgi:ketosteroid isomerase-like protein
MSTATLQAPVTRAQVTKDEADILALLETRRQAHRDKDGAAIAALYSSDAAYFSLAPPLTHHGVDRQEKQAWLDSWATPVEIESRDFNLTVSGDFAFGHGFLRLSGTKKGAEGKVDFWMRQTVHLERQGSTWRIIHDHASVPFYMDGTLRPAFDLQP